MSAARPDQRDHHPFGIADRSGFAAMGCDEVLVHGADLASTFGLTSDPPVERRWLWQCAPLSEWDGRPRSMPERRAPDS